MAKNKVFLNQDGLIEIQVVGDQNAASIELMGRELDVLITRLKALDKPALVLDDLLQIGKVDAKGRKQVVDLGKNLNFDKLAMVGKGGLLRLGANLLLSAIGRGDKMRFFNDRAPAVEWLREEAV